MSNLKTLLTASLAMVLCIGFESSAQAQIGSKDSSRINPIRSGLGSLLSGLTRPPVMPPPIHAIRPVPTFNQTTVYCEPQTSYLYSSIPAYNYAPPTYVQSTTNIYPGFNHYQTSGLTPAREWGTQSQSFVTSRQIAGYGSGASSNGNSQVFSSKPPAKSQVAAQTALTPANESENSRMIGMAMGRAGMAFERGAYDEARAEYAKALFLSEDDYTARFCMGIAAFAQGEFKDAGEAVYESVLAAPESVAKIDVSRMIGNKDDLQIKLAGLREDLTSNPDDAEIAVLTAIIEHASGNPSDAIQKLERINSPRQVRPISQLIKFLKSSNQPPRA